MSELAIDGGTPVRRNKSWPTWPVHDEREVELILEVTRSGNWSFEGPMEDAFAEAFPRFNGAKYCVLVANGTIAIQLALEALDLGPGDEVVVPGLTWQATAAACVDVNAIPVLADVDSDTFCLDPDKIREAITPQTRAIIPVHLCGCMADMDATLQIAREHDLAVVEDCAQACGSQWRGKGCGTLGDIGCFSFQQRKMITSGEGGAIVTNNRDLFHRLYSLKNCGRIYPGSDSKNFQSGNYRITEFQAAILLAQLERLEMQLPVMTGNAAYLTEELTKIEGLLPFKQPPQMTRRAHYVYFVRYDQDAFGGLPIGKFREALGAELGMDTCGPQGSCLNCDPLFQPHTKKRYHINEAHWKALDPTQYELPVSAGPKNVIGIFHNYLLAGRDDMADIVTAAKKIRNNVRELLNDPME